MVAERTVRSYLRRSIILSESLEAIASSTVSRNKSTLVGFGFLVRNRRLAQAILQLGSWHAYEGRMLLRSMIEIHINYAWIRLRDRESRANRFMKFDPLERLRILEELSGLIDPKEYRAKLREFRNKRAKVKHLFRNPIKRGKNKGKLQWDKTWASKGSVEGRLKEVLTSKTGNYDPFLYALYRWSSSAIHGGPTSLNEVLEKDSPLRAKIQPEANPAAQLVGAFVVLMATMETLAESSDMLENLEPELTKLQRALNRLRI